jgi:hypothetical protein
MSRKVALGNGKIGGGGPVETAELVDVVGGEAFESALTTIEQLSQRLPLGLSSLDKLTGLHRWGDNDE